jgi:hypothetical protein
VEAETRSTAEAAGQTAGGRGARDSRATGPKGPSWLESMVGSGLLAEVKRNQNVLDAFSKSYLSSINRTLDAVGKSHNEHPSQPRCGA